MNFFESALAVVVFLSSGGFWLGYVYLSNDAKCRIAKSTGGSVGAMATKEEVERLRREVKALEQALFELRERSTEFDLSLQSSLQHLLDERLRGRAEAEAELRRVTG